MRSFEGRPTVARVAQGPSSSRDGPFLLGKRPMANRLVLVRHARLDADHAGRLVGAHRPAPGRVAGQQQAARPGRPHRPAARRAAAAFAAPCSAAGRRPRRLPAGLPIEIDHDLREIDFGRWENRRFDELAADEPELVERWAAFAVRLRLSRRRKPRRLSGPGRGAGPTAWSRDPADTVLAVTHGGVIRAMICHLLGLEPRQLRALRGRLRGRGRAPTCSTARACSPSPAASERMRGGPSHG